MYTPDELAEIRNAYIVLNVPRTASARLIKKAYRDMIKKWHPDLFPAGSDDQELATEMTQKMNESYRLIKDAPMQNHIQADMSANVNAGAREPASSGEENRDVEVFYYPLWLRIIFSVFGVILGAVSIGPVMASMSLILYKSKFIAFILYIMGVTACGILADRCGENFWKEPL